MTTWLTKIKFDESTQNYFLPIPGDLLEKLAWKIGDDILLSIEDGGMTLRKAEKTDSENTH